MIKLKVKTSAPAQTRIPVKFPFSLIGLIFVAVALYTTFVISSSFSIGRLSNDSSYDDVDYLNMGYPLYRAFQDQGLPGMIQKYYFNPQRSMYSSFAGACGFTLFGIHDWAPYTTNAVILAVFLGYAVYLFRNQPKWLKAAVFVYILALPLAAFIISEFKPDSLSGILIAMGCLIVLGTGNTDTGKHWKRFAMAGACFGFSIIAKSTVFPFTYGMAVLAFAGGLFLAMRYDGAPRTLASASKLASAFGIPLVAISALQMVPAGKMMFDYIKSAAFSCPSCVYIPFKECLRYYWDGAGSIGFRSTRWICSVLLIQALVLVVRNGDSRKRMFTSLALLLGLIAYFFVSLNPTKNAHIGIPVQSFVILLPLFLLSWIFDSPGQKRATAASVFSAVVMGSAAFFFVPALPLDKNFWYWDGDGAKRKQINATLVEAISRDTPKEAGSRKVFVATMGFVNADTIQWLFNKADRDFQVSTNTNEMKAVLKAALKADYIITGETLAEGQYTWYPSNKNGSAIDETLSSTLGIRRIASVHSRTGPEFRVYRNENRIFQKNFFGWNNLEGLISYQRQPYLLALGRAPSVEFEAENAGDFILGVALYPKVPAPGPIGVWNNGQKVSEIPMQAAMESRQEIHFKAVKGSNIIRFEPTVFEEHPAKDGKFWSVDFSRLTVRPAEAETGPVR